MNTTSCNCCKSGGGESAPKVCKLNAENEAFYTAKNKRFAKVFDFLRANNLEKMAQFADGKQVIDGDEIFVNFATVNLKKPNDAKFEVHDKYIDLQFVITGEESMGIKPRGELKNFKENLIEAKDVIFYTDAPENFVNLKAGEFVVFFPNNGHAPAIGDGTIKKCIFKIKAD